MTMSDLDRLLNATLLGTSDRISVTVTDVPDLEVDLRELLDKALEMATRKRTVLSEIQLPMSRFPAVGAQYWHVPVTDSGNHGVVRLIYGEQIDALAA
ncbi:MAG: hypothetical protein Q7T73_09160 [Beijerinckiaceae bacterium]|jgi:hypothetical protein|nr:hypothetical protein [Beijerinckiaceae bacterium]